jgi:hypothetical protein
MENSTEENNRKFQFSNQKVPRMSGALTYRDVACGYLRDTWSPLRNGPKLLARIADATPRAVANWFAKEAAPNGETLITLMARDPEFKRIILELVEARTCNNKNTGGPQFANGDGAASAGPAD